MSNREFICIVYKLYRVDLFEYIWTKNAELFSIMSKAQTNSRYTLYLKKWTHSMQLINPRHQTLQ